MEDMRSFLETTVMYLLYDWVKCIKVAPEKESCKSPSKMQQSMPEEPVQSLFYTNYMSYVIYFILFFSDFFVLFDLLVIVYLDFFVVSGHVHLKIEDINRSLILIYDELAFALFSRVCRLSS